MKVQFERPQNDAIKLSFKQILVQNILSKLVKRDDPNIDEVSLAQNISRTPLFGRILSNLQNSRIGENKALLKAEKVDQQSTLNALHDITELNSRIRARKLQVESVKSKTSQLKQFMMENKGHVSEE
jgi:hypothetical protein